MNYRHIYHAGNFADIVKHLALIACLNEIAKKDKAYAVLDAFAGTGLYDLASEQAIRTNESSEGITKLYAIDNDNPNLYLLGKLTQLNKVRPNNYLGSPKIIEHYLRPIDRLIASELHPDDYQTLSYNFKYKRNVQIINLDAYGAIKAHLPFKENRGLVLIDPPFEVTDEFARIVKSLRLIKERARNLCTIVWYPIKDILKVKNFYNECREIGFKEILKIEFTLNDSAFNLTKCGLLIFNPPNIMADLKLNLAYLAQTIYNKKADYSIKLL